MYAPQSPFEEEIKQSDRSSTYDKHLSEQSTPRGPNGGYLQEMAASETFNECEERQIRMMRESKSSWAAKCIFDNQTSPGGSTFVPGMCCGDD